MLKNDADNNISYNNTNWAYQIKTMINDIGLTELWINQDTLQIIIPTYIMTIKTKASDNYYQTWYTDIQKFSKTFLHMQRYENFSYLRTIYNLEHYNTNKNN